MKNEYFIAMGFRGALDADLAVNTLENYIAKDSEIQKKGGRPLFTPLVESDPKRKPIHFQLGTSESLHEKVREIYRDLCDPSITKPEDFFPGPFGDFMRILDMGNQNYMFDIGHKAYVKPGLAADLAVIIKGEDVNKNEVLYLVTGIRKNDPGKGKSALFGGFRNVERGEDGLFKFDSSPYTLLHEAIEEAGLKIEHHSPNYLRTLYEYESIPVMVTLGKDTKNPIEVESKLLYLDTIPTSDLSLEEGGEKLADGSKRVYATDGYLIIADLGKEILSDEKISGCLNPGDDIEQLRFLNVTEYVISDHIIGLFNKLDFGIAHHKKFVNYIIKKAHEVYVNVK